jgi:hypothetical protein
MFMFMPMLSMCNNLGLTASILKRLFIKTDLLCTHYLYDYLLFWSPLSFRHYSTVRYCLVYKFSYREIKEIIAERDSHVDHSIINLCVLKYAPLLEYRAQKRKKPVASSWLMDETYINVKDK